MVIARLLQEARVKPTDIVLDVGAGTGYASALLSRLAATVVALESDAELAARRDATLRELGVDNVVLVQGPLEQGYAKQAPYDVILLARRCGGSTSCHIGAVGRRRQVGYSRLARRPHGTGSSVPAHGQG